MVRRVRGHLCQKCDSREIEIITTWLEVGDRICCAIQFSHDGRRRLGRLTRVPSGSKDEVEESRRSSTARRSRRSRPRAEGGSREEGEEGPGPPPPRR